MTTHQAGETLPVELPYPVPRPSAMAGASRTLGIGSFVRPAQARASPALGEVSARPTPPGTV